MNYEATHAFSLSKMSYYFVYFFGDNLKKIHVNVSFKVFFKHPTSKF